MQKENEVFVPVKGFESRFKISNYGTVVSINGRRLGEHKIANGIDGNGYRITTLRSHGKKWYVRVHVLVAMHFVENHKPNEYDTVNHLDGDKLNNHFSNLEWCTRAENMSHAFRTGLVDKKGEKHHNSKLTERAVIEIREKYKNGYTMLQLGKEHGVDYRTISDIVNRVCWAHI